MLHILPTPRDDKTGELGVVATIRLDRQHPTDSHGGNLWHDLQEHAGIRLGLGLSIRLGGDPPQRRHSAGLVQGERLVLGERIVDQLKPVELDLQTTAQRAAAPL